MAHTIYIKPDIPIDWPMIRKELGLVRQYQCKDNKQGFSREELVQTSRTLEGKGLQASYKEFEKKYGKYRYQQPRSLEANFVSYGLDNMTKAVTEVVFSYKGLKILQEGPIQEHNMYRSSFWVLIPGFYQLPNYLGEYYFRADRKLTDPEKRDFLAFIRQQFLNHDVVFGEKDIQIDIEKAAFSNGESREGFIYHLYFNPPCENKSDGGKLVS